MNDGSMPRSSHDKSIPLPQVIYSLDSEEAILGIMLVHSLEVIDDIRIHLIKESFFVPAHQEIYECILDLHDEGGGVDVGLCHEYLASKKMADKIGSPGILAELMNAFSTSFTVWAHVEIVKDKYLARCVQKACLDSLKNIQDGTEDIPFLLNQIERAVSASITPVNTTERTFGIEITQTADEIIQWANRGGGLRGLPTGFQRIDNITGGWQPGQMIVVAARAGVGKSALALTFARSLVRDQWNEETRSCDILGYPVGIFSLEMEYEELNYRILSAHGNIPLRSLIDGKISENERLALRDVSENIKHWPLHIDTQRGLSIQQIRSRARKMKAKHNIKALIIDYMQRIKNPSYREKLDQLEDISGQCCDMAGELKIPIIVLAQLNRDVKNEEPQIYHIKGSGAIEQDASLVFLLHEIEEEAEHEGKLKKYWLNLAKQRNGKTERIRIEYQAWKTLFTEIRN